MYIATNVCAYKYVHKILIDAKLMDNISEEEDDETFIILFSISAGINLLIAMVTSTCLLMRICRK